MEPPVWWAALTRPDEAPAFARVEVGHAEVGEEDDGDPLADAEDEHWQQDPRQELGLGVDPAQPGHADGGGDQGADQQDGLVDTRAEPADDADHREEHARHRDVGEPGGQWAEATHVLEVLAQEVEGGEHRPDDQE